jgi:hypothetical protein
MTSTRQPCFDLLLNLYLCLFLFLLPFLVSNAQVTAQSTVDTAKIAPPNGLKVFLDCGPCDNDYVRTEIAYVNYVRDRLQADVHILVTRQRTGGDGREYTLTFIGDNRFEGVNDTLIYTTNQTQTDDDERRGIVQVLKNGLFRYVLQTPQGRHQKVTYVQPSGVQEIVDPWDYWVFRINTNASLDGEVSSNSLDAGIGLDVTRTTEQWKLRLEADAGYNEDKYSMPGSAVVSITSVSPTTS